MNKLIALVVVLFSLTAMADDSKHMVTFGNNVTMGWSGSAATADVDSGLGIKDFTISNGEFAVNYAYRLASRFQLGFYLSNELDEQEVKARAGGKVKSEENHFSVYLLGTYNFSDDLSNAWYISAGIGKEYSKTETTDSTGGTVDKSETDYDVTGYILQVGKRFELKGLGIQNLTYSPSLTIHHGEAGGDLEDGGVNSLTAVTLDLIKFDLLF